jgi:uncharacterized membrane protein YeaQ/YmgE (transglycosylase-associated protein family)
MSIIMFIILGGLIGFIASRLMHRDEGIVASIAIGIVGSFIGSLIARIFDSSASYMSLTWASFLWSLIGAIILVAIMNSVSSRHHHTTMHH